MKRRHIFLGNLIHFSGDEFYDYRPQDGEVRPERFRWFGGLHDLDATFVCQAL